MAKLRKIAIQLILIVLGLLGGLVIFEGLLHLIPEMTFRRMVVYRPQRYDVFQEDRDIGWVHIPGVSRLSHSEGEYEVLVQINSKGLHDVERDYSKPPGTLRVLMLGDSFVDAGQVEMSQNTASQLQTCLIERLDRPVEVINGGASYYGPGDELLFLQYEGLKYQPDLVLTGFFVGNDFENVLHEEDDTMIKTFGGYRFELEDGQLTRRWISWEEPEGNPGLVERVLRRHSRIHLLLRHHDSRIYRYYLRDWQKHLKNLGFAQSEAEEGKSPPPWNLHFYSRGFPNNPTMPEQSRYAWELLQAIVEETRAVAESNGARYAVFIIPEVAQVDQDAYQVEASKYSSKWNMGVTAWDVAAPNKAAVEMYTAKGIPVLDLLPLLFSYAANSDEALYYPRDKHFTAEGHRVAAEHLCGWLIDDGLVEP